MLGIIFTGIAQFFAEISTSIGKYEVEHKRESFYAFGFLNAFWATVFLIAIALMRGEFVFSMASLPTFALRVVLESILMFVSLKAVIVADRSTFSFIRVSTIPLLLGADLALGYAISTPQFAGIALILIALVILFTGEGLGRTGKLWSLFSAVLAAATLTLYKYNIEHFNSVEAEQALLHTIMFLVLLVAARWYTRESLFALLIRPPFLVQSLFSGIASVLLSYAYVFAPASIITTAKRVFEILGAITSGQMVFHEKNLAIKLFSFALIAIGLVFLVS